jgi:Uma2 family endonuclease
MSGVLRGPTAETFEAAALKAMREQAVDDVMESWNHARQRAITVSAAPLIARRVRKFSMFNEMLVQYLVRGDETIHQVVPDNMIVLSEGPFDELASFNVPYQPVGPFMVMEYVSTSSERKDYDTNLTRYERHLKVPYYLLFNPEAQELILYRHNGRRYVSTPPYDAGLYPVPELEMHVGIIDDWVRYWHRGTLLPLPDELEAMLEAERGERADAERAARSEKRRADREARAREKAEADRDALAAEVARLREQLGLPPG